MLDERQRPLVAGAHLELHAMEALLLEDERRDEGRVVEGSPAEADDQVDSG